MSIGRRGSSVYQLRFALGRLLQEFHADLDGLASKGLLPTECDVVQQALRDTANLFKSNAKGPISANGEVGKHLDKYYKIYVDWNGHEGASADKALLRGREIKKLREQRSKLFRKLSARQAELALDPQVDMFAPTIGSPFYKLSESLPDQFPRLRQATAFFGG